MKGKLVVLFKGVGGDKSINIENATVNPISNQSGCFTYKIEFDLPKEFDTSLIGAFVSFEAESGARYQFSDAPTISGRHFVAIGLH